MSNLSGGPIFTRVLALLLAVSFLGSVPAFAANPSAGEWVLDSQIQVLKNEVDALWTRSKLVYLDLIESVKFDASNTFVDDMFVMQKKLGDFGTLLHNSPEASEAQILKFEALYQDSKHLTETFRSKVNELIFMDSFFFEEAEKIHPQILRKNSAVQVDQVLLKFLERKNDIETLTERMKRIPSKQEWGFAERKLIEAMLNQINSPEDLTRALKSFEGGDEAFRSTRAKKYARGRLIISYLSKLKDGRGAPSPIVFQTRRLMSAGLLGDQQAAVLYGRFIELMASPASIGKERATMDFEMLFPVPHNMGPEFYRDLRGHIAAHTLKIITTPLRFELVEDLIRGILEADAASLTRVSLRNFFTAMAEIHAGGSMDDLLARVMPSSVTNSCATDLSNLVK